MTIPHTPAPIAAVAAIAARAAAAASIAVAAVHPPLAGAQGTAARTGHAVVDSAQVAREAWARANAAARAGDLTAARREVDRAVSAWPTQPAYVWGRAALAAQTGDTAATLDALRAYASLGLGRDLRAGAVGAIAGAPVFDAVRADHARHLAPIAQSTVFATISDTAFWAEGMDVDPRDRTVFVASIRRRTVTAVDTTGATRSVVTHGAGLLGAVLAVRVDTARDALWLTTSGIPQMAGYTPGDSTIAALVRVGLRDGAVQRRWNLPVRAGGHVLGDVAVARSGDVYFTDSVEPILYRLRPGVDTLERIAHPLFRSLQGVATPPGDSVVFVADYSHGLLRVDLRTGDVIRLADAPNSTSLGCDGIVWDGTAIVAVQNGVLPARVVRFALDRSGRRIERVDVLDRNPALATDPTIGTVVGRDYYYVGNSQWAQHDDTGVPLAGARLRPTQILKVPLPAR